MDAAESAREAWARVCRAAATRSESELGDAVRYALAVPVDESDIVDALLAGNPALDDSDALSLIETERARSELLRNTFPQLTTAWFTLG